MKPNEVNEDNMHIVQTNIIKHARRHYKPKIQVGDTVVCQAKRQKLKKGYKNKFSNTVHIVEKIEKPYYYLKDEDKLHLAAQLFPVKEVEANPEKIISPEKRGRTRAVEVNIPVPNNEERHVSTRKRIPSSSKPILGPLQSIGKRFPRDSKIQKIREA